jgi:hypothetical protein
MSVVNPSRTISTPKEQRLQDWAGNKEIPLISTDTTVSFRTVSNNGKLTFITDSILPAMTTSEHRETLRRLCNGIAWRRPKLRLLQQLSWGRNASSRTGSSRSSDDGALRHRRTTTVEASQRPVSAMATTSNAQGGEAVVASAGARRPPCVRKRINREELDVCVVYNRIRLEPYLFGSFSD